MRKFRMPSRISAKPTVCPHKPTPIISTSSMPGMGGTQRLPRLVGLALGLDMILSARNLKASKALRAGLVDEVVPRSILEDRAAALALSIAGGKTPQPARP